MAKNTLEKSGTLGCRAHVFLAHKLTVGFTFYSSDFETNEKKIMDELDKLAKTAQGGKKGGSKQDAADGTEEIRQWVSLTFLFR